MSRRSPIPAAGDGGTRQGSRRWHVQRSSQASRPPRKPSPRPRLVIRLLAWVPLVAVAAAAVGVVGGMLGTLFGRTLLGVTVPEPPRFSNALNPAWSSWTLAPHSVDGRIVRPAVSPASLTVEVVSLDLASGTALLRVGLHLSGGMGARLRMDSAGRSFVPLARVSRAAWAQLPVGIQLVNCADPLISISIQRCNVPNASVPLGNLVGGGGNVVSAGTAVVPVSLPVDGSPNLFPSDRYVIRMSPVITLPGSISLPGLSSYLNNVPVAVTLSEGSALAQYEVTAFVDSPQQPRIIAVEVTRASWRVITVYVVALLPLLLAVVLAHVWVRRRTRPNFDLGFAAGLIAAMLAILPLRAVLVPGDVAAVSPTVVDDILILGVLLIAGFLFWQYARFVGGPRPSRSLAADSPPGEVPGIHHPATDGGDSPGTTSA